MTPDQLRHWRGRHCPQASIAQFAETLGTSRTAMYRWLAGEVDIPDWVPGKLDLVDRCARRASLPPAWRRLLRVNITA